MNPNLIKDVWKVYEAKRWRESIRNVVEDVYGEREKRKE